MSRIIILSRVQNTVTWLQMVTEFPTWGSEMDFYYSGNLTWSHMVHGEQLIILKDTEMNIFASYMHLSFKFNYFLSTYMYLGQTVLQQEGINLASQADARATARRQKIFFELSSGNQHDCLFSRSSNKNSDPWFCVFVFSFNKKTMRKT
jgi:hypothetical protein